MRKKRKKADLPAPLVRGRTRFERWRRTREQHRIPEALWRSAVKLAESHGIHRTARALRLDYYALKKRVASEGAPRGGETTAFVEWIPTEVCGTRSGGGEWVVELENAHGERMRVHAKGESAVDIAQLSAMFWDTDR